MNERSYPNGTYPLADAEREELGVEWVAAMYESWAADREWNRGETAITRPEVTNPGTWRETHPSMPSILEYGESLHSLAEYGRAAQRLAEEIEAERYTVRFPWQSPDCPGVAFHGDPQHVCP